MSEPGRTFDGGAGKTFAKLAAMAGKDLVATLELKKPGADDPELDDRLKTWADGLKAGALAADRQTD